MASRLETLFRASPARAIPEALASPLRPASKDAALFVVKYADQLQTLDDVALAVRLCRASEPDDTPSRALVERAVTLLEVVDDPQRMLLALMALWPLRPDATAGLGQDGWRELVALSRGKLPEKWWWWLVDWTRGCALYDALAQAPRTREPIPEPGPWIRLSDSEREAAKHLPTAFRDFERLAESASSPLVLGLLDDPNNEARVRDAALDLPLEIVLKLEEKGFVSRDDVEQTAWKRANDPSSTEDWPVPLPDWLREQAKVRAFRCAHPSLALTRWLDSNEAGDLEFVKLGYSKYLAALGSERDPVKLTAVYDHGAYWSRRLGAFLATGTAWKTVGRELLDLCVDVNRGFPQRVLWEAIAAIEPSASSTREKLKMAILQRAHDVTAAVFLDRASSARVAGDWATVARFLAALFELDCGSFVRPRLHALGKPLGDETEPIPESVAAWIESCRNVTRAGRRAPSEEGLIAAFNVLLEVGR